MSDERPDPDALLAQLEAEHARAQRGKLKIFFGASPGVGKTYAMLSAARLLVAQGVDLMVVVVEPGRRSVETAASVRRMAGEIGVRRYAIIGNKVASEADRAFLESALAGEDYLGGLPFSETIRRADRENLPLVDIIEEPLRAQFCDVWEKVKERAAR